MLIRSRSIEIMAEELVEAHGARARQKVVDEIVAAVRDQDIERAKQWAEIGKAVDQRLNV